MNGDAETLKAKRLFAGVVRKERARLAQVVDGGNRIWAERKSTSVKTKTVARTSIATKMVLETICSRSCKS